MAKKTVTTHAWCFEFSLKNGERLGFTNHHNNITINGLTYNKYSSVDNSALQKKNKFHSDNMEIIGIINHNSITEEDLESGKFDGAKVKIIIVNYNNPEDDNETIFTGICGNITTHDGTFVIEIDGIQSKLNNTIGELYSPNCRAKFCDKRCGLSKKSFSKSAFVSSVINETSFIISSPNHPKGYYDYGLIEFTNGKNKNIPLEIRHSNKGTIELTMPPPYPINSGDKFLITAGCDKTFDTCCNKFNNAINFRGEPHIPGKNKLNKV